MILTLANNHRRTIEFTGSVPAVFGIVNVTPDSFSDGGRYPDSTAAADEAIRMLAQGAAGIDIGAESTRPGAKEVPAEIEIQRLLPVVCILRKHCPDAIISVDTRKASVARAVLENGADIINDVSGLTFDPDMAGTIAYFNAGVILMHSRGTPETMRDPAQMQYTDVVSEVVDSLNDIYLEAVSAGIRSDSILLDPGLGFAKTPAQDWALIRNAGRMREKVPAPLLYGPSRKSFLSTICSGKTAADRDFATAGVLCRLTAQKVDAVRVHNVAVAEEAMKAFAK